ncbi:S9 family peptidase [Methylocella sp.]|uniref:S9 family peptidase n=1 Tax=Methylocella sp. TaxID=1978226 RepID=UPI0037846AA2
MTPLPQAPVPPPPAAREPHVARVHGVELSDEYAWMRAENWREVLRDPSALPADVRAALEAENEYAAQTLLPFEALRKTLVAEMRGRVKEDDAQAPLPDGLYLYYACYDQGAQHPSFRRSQEDGGKVEVLLDAEAESRGKPFFELAHARHTPDHAKFGWSADEKGSELHLIRVRDLATGEDLPDVVADTDGSFVFGADSAHFYYVRIDDDNRPAQVLRHRLGEDPARDEIVFAEADPRWFIHLKRSQSGAFAVISVSDHDAAEAWLIDLADPQARPRRVEPRAPGLRYEVEHRGGRLYILTNADGAQDFFLASAPLEAPGKASWSCEVPHRPGRMIVDFAVFPEHLVWLERENGLPRLMVRHIESGEDHAVAFDEEAYSFGLEERLAFDQRSVRFVYSSMTTPRETYDYDLSTRARVLRKRQEIPSGHDPAAYVSRRVYAPAADGELVPVSLIHRRGLDLSAGPPLLLYGYGAYGHSVPAGFSAPRLCLIDRGFVFAIAHIRGGTDKGWRWYLDGKLENKKNTFTDFIAAARHLIAQGFTREGNIVAHGGSAGGMLMGAVVNMAPELFAGIVADVPFVDVLNTILDAELPLTPPEWLEWGDPIREPAAFARIRSYSPYDNVEAKRYPPIFALGGLTDPRVTYWEPLKWISRLRARAGGGPFLCRTNMAAGHGGASGRFDRLEEAALQQAFAIACAQGAFRAGRESVSPTPAAP